MGGRHRFIGFTAALLRVLVWLNIACAAGFALALVALVPGAGVMLAQLAHKYGPGVDAGGILWGVRATFAIGLVAALVVHPLLVALLAAVRSVRAGDPFVRGNVARLRTIGWTMLAIQLLDLGFGTVERHLAALGAELPAWQPSLGGWLTVLVAFVLAHVFAHGAAMRDDLAGTV